MQVSACPSTLCFDTASKLAQAYKENPNLSYSSLRIAMARQSRQAKERKEIVFRLRPLEGLG